MIAVQDYIEDSPVVESIMIEFSPFNRDKYISMFEDFKNKNVIDKSCNFDDKKWITILHFDGIGISFNFSETIFKKMLKKQNTSIDYNYFILAIKSFYLYQLKSHTPGTLKEFIVIFKFFIKHTEFTSTDTIPDFLLSNAKLMAYTPMILDFFMYCEYFDFNENILDKLVRTYTKYQEDKANGEDNNKRALPSFDTMFRFNNIMNEFIESSSGDDREKFFPLILWWKITTIIPLRTKELTLIPKDCIVMDGKCCKLKLYRSSLKGNRKKIRTHDFNSSYKPSIHVISDEIKDLIMEYQDIVQEYDNMENFFCDGMGDIIDRNFLFSSRSYYKFNKNKATYCTYKYDLDYFSSNLVNKLLKRFLYEIIYLKYGINLISKSKNPKDIFTTVYNNCINTITIMDTRHFAIMNMIYMGYEPDTIQDMVEHTNIHTSYSYYSHMEIFTNCYTVSIAKKLAFSKNSAFKHQILSMDFENIFGSDGNGNVRYKAVKSKKLYDNNKYIKLDDGFCSYDKEDLIPCKLVRGNHMRCKFFHPNQEHLTSIGEELNTISDEISSEIDTLNYIIRNKKYIKNYRDLYYTSLNKIQSKTLIKSEMISDYIINGIDLE